MAQIETQGILQDIETLVSDHLQMVSYKWLSRNYLVSSNDAKRLLQEFVENHANGLEVVYALSGELKNDPISYHVRLVPGTQLSEAKEEFDGNCSVRVYSVQTSIPKDPATMWNAEFVQAEELHTQAPAIENCLRDNRFCGILNSFVTRNVVGASSCTAGSLRKTQLSADPSKVNVAHQGIVIPKLQQKKEEQSSPRASLQAPNVVKDVKAESNGTGVTHQPSKPPTDKQKVVLPASKKKVQTDKSSSASGGSLANLWGRASVKSKSNSTAENNNLVPIHNGDSADAQILAQEAECGGISDDDDDQDVSFKRASSSEVTRKRRVVFDLSDDDECEDAINLASPECPDEKLDQEAKESSKNLVPHKSNLKFDKQEEEKPEDKKDISVDGELKPPCREDSMVVRNDKNSPIILTERTNRSGPEINPTKMDKLATTSKIQRDAGIILTEKKRNSPENDVNKMDKPTNGASRSSQRRKVLKTRIDERGREVTEIVWEGKEPEVKKADSGTTIKSDSSTVKEADSSTTKKADSKVISVTNRPPTALKSVANTGAKNPTAKAGGKKAVNKDPKQGSIMSFFKKS